MTQPIAGTAISWITFGFLVIVGLESSQRFSEKLKILEEKTFIERFMLRQFLYTVSPGFWFICAMLVLFVKPFSTEWIVIVTISYILILYTLFRKIMAARVK